MGYVIIMILYLRSQTSMLDVDNLQVDSVGGTLQVEVHPPNVYYPTIAACQAALAKVGDPNVGYPYNIANSWCQAK